MRVRCVEAGPPPPPDKPSDNPLQVQPCPTSPAVPFPCRRQAQTRMTSLAPFVLPAGAVPLLAITTSQAGSTRNVPTSLAPFTQPVRPCVPPSQTDGPCQTRPRPLPRSIPALAAPARRALPYQSTSSHSLPVRQAWSRQPSRWSRVTPVPIPDLARPRRLPQHKYRVPPRASSSHADSSRLVAAQRRDQVLPLPGRHTIPFSSLALAPYPVLSCPTTLGQRPSLPAVPSWPYLPD